MKSKIVSVMILSMLFIAGLYLWNRTNDPAPSGMVLIPAGEFIMGTNENGFSVDPASILPNKPLLKDERPAHAVYLDTFAIDRTKVRNRDYEHFAIASGRSLPAGLQEADPSRPATGLTWQEAADYCASVGKRLPDRKSVVKPNGKKRPAAPTAESIPGEIGSILRSKKRSGPPSPPNRSSPPTAPKRWSGSDGSGPPTVIVPTPTIPIAPIPSGKTSAPFAAGSEAINPARFVSSPERQPASMPIPKSEIR